MKEVVLRNDNAVSPIIATILLIAITVTLASTLYSIVGGYFSNAPVLTPQANIAVVNMTKIASDGTGTGSYIVYIESVSGNISLSYVRMMVTLNTGNITTLPLLSIGPNGIFLTTHIVANLTKGSNTFSPLDFISIKENNAHQFVTRIAFIDTASSGIIASAYPQ
ncbi:MAG: type IV pilin [Thermoplasmataceae archaeon]